MSNTTNSEMVATTPSWLTLDFVQDVLRRSESDNSIEVVDMFVKMATKMGDNYSSDIIRVYTDFTRKQGNRDCTEKKSLIVKLAPTEGARKDIIADFGVFGKEISMMTDALPKMNEILGMEHRLGARALHVQKEEPSFLIVEDLAPLGFQMADRESGLDLAHSVMAIKNIAKFHASSIILCEKNPSYKKLYEKGMFHSDFELKSEFTIFFKHGIIALADEVESWPELGEKYAKKLRVIAEKVYELGINAVTRDEDEFNVINHGDCWVNNMLFKYNDEGKPVNHIFVDFQISSYTSPAIDLLYFLNTSPCKEVYETSTQYLLDQYLETLTSTLRELGYKGEIPTMAKLKKALDKRMAYALIAAFTVLPIVLADKNNIKAMDEMLADGYDNPAYKNDRYRQVINKRIIQFDELGILDRFQ